MQIPPSPERENRRFERQFDALGRAVPGLRRPLRAIRARGWWIIRLPVALFLIGGAFLAILPVFGLWMLPLGLMLMAIDLPLLRGPISRLMIRGRRRYTLWRHKNGNGRKR